MKNSPIFKILSENTKVTNLLKDGTILRVFNFGNAPQGVKKPYVNYTQISGQPINYLGDTPDMETERLQIDSYAETTAEAREVAKKVEEALEKFCYIVSYNGEDFENDTKLYKVSFDIEFHNRR